MSNTEKEKSLLFSWNTTNKVMWLLAPVLISAAVVFSGPLMVGAVGNVVFIVSGAVLGIVTFFVSAGYSYKLEVNPGSIRIVDRRQPTVIPLDKIGLLVRNGGFPFPTLWLILKNAGIGKELPSKKVDPKVREMVEAYQKRNPGKSLTYIPIQGGYLRSIPEFAAELKRRIPPLTIDERLGLK